MTLGGKKIQTSCEVTLEGEFAGLYGFEASGDYFRTHGWEPASIENLAIGPVYKYDGREDLDGEHVHPMPEKLQTVLTEVAVDKLFDRAAEMAEVF